MESRKALVTRATAAISSNPAMATTHMRLRLATAALLSAMVSPPCGAAATMGGCRAKRLEPRRGAPQQPPVRIGAKPEDQQGGAITRPNVKGITAHVKEFGQVSNLRHAACSRRSA